MFALYLEYAREEEDEHSVSRRAALLATTPNLDLDDVEELKSTTNGVPDSRFRITEKVLTSVLRTMTELQVFIERMAALITERPEGKYFVIDPGEVIRRTLTRSQNLAQLQAGWLMLAQRLGAAQKFIAKYIQEYQDGPQPVPTSPISTTASLYEGLEAESNTENKLKLAFATLPRHANRLSEEDRLTLRKYGSWEDTKVVPSWLLATKPAPSSKKEVQILTPIEEVDDGVARSSRSRNSEEAEEIYTAGVKGKEKAVSWRNDFEPFQTLPLMGGGTPFKSNRTFFEDPEQRGQKSTETPFAQKGKSSNQPAAQTPNVLYGMGVPGPRSGSSSVFSSISQYNPRKSSKDQRTTDWGSTTPGPSNSGNRSEPGGQYKDQPLFPNSSYRNPAFVPLPEYSRETPHTPIQTYTADYTEYFSEDGERETPEAPASVGGGFPPDDEPSTDDDESSDQGEGRRGPPPERGGRGRGGNAPPPPPPP